MTSQATFMFAARLEGDRGRADVHVRWIERRRKYTLSGKGKATACRPSKVAPEYGAVQQAGYFAG